MGFDQAGGVGAQCAGVGKGVRHGEDGCRGGTCLSHRRRACQWMRATTDRLCSGMAGASPPQGPVRQRLQLAAPAGAQQRLAGFVVVVDAGQQALARLGWRGGAHEAKPIAAAGLAERRHMEHLARLQRGSPGQAVGWVVGMQHIGVALTEGVVHLGHHGTQVAVGAMRVPEADRLEDPAPQSGKSLQPDFAVGPHPLAVQQAFDPTQRVALAVAVVAVVEAHDAAAVDRHTWKHRMGAQLAHRQQQEPAGIAESVQAGRQPSVDHLATAEQGRRAVGGPVACRAWRVRVHQAAQFRDVASRWCKRCRRSCTTCSADARPSSWKP
jgi:hypothetical protein